LTNSIDIQISFTPVFNAQAFNSIISAVKSSLGDLGKNIQLLDVDRLNADMSKFVNQANQELKGIHVQAIDSTEFAAAGQKAGAQFKENAEEGINGLESVFAQLGVMAAGAFAFKEIYEGVASFIEAGAQMIEQSEKMKLAFAQAGIATEDLDKTVADVIQGITELSNQFAIPIAEIQKYSQVAAAIGGATGQANKDLTMLAIGVEKVTAGMVSGEMAIRVFSKSVTDPETEMSMGRLTKQFPALTAALKGITDPAEKTAAALRFFGPTFAELAAQAEGPIGSFNRLVNSSERLKQSIGAAAIEAFAPLIRTIADDVVPALTSVITFFGSLNESATPLADIVKIAGIAFAAMAIGLGVASIAAVASVPIFASMAVAVWAALAPILPFVAAAALLGVAIADLAGAFDQSTESKIKDSEASEELIKKQEEQNLSNQKLAQSNLDLIADYQRLIQVHAKAAAGTEEYNKENKQLLAMQEKLARSYPGVIQLGEDHSASIEKLKSNLSLYNVELDKSTESNHQLVLEYEELGKKADNMQHMENLSTEEKKRLRDATAELNNEFPGVISSTKSFTENLDSLKTHAGMSSNELRKLVEQMTGLQEKQIEIVKDTQRLRVQAAGEALASLLPWTNTLLGIGAASAGANEQITYSFNRLKATLDPGTIEEQWINLFNLINNSKIGDKDKLSAIDALDKLKQAKLAELDLFAGINKQDAEMTGKAKDRVNYEIEISKLRKEYQTLSKDAWDAEAKSLKAQIEGDKTVSKAKADQYEKEISNIGKVDKEKDKQAQKDVEYANHINDLLVKQAEERAKFNETVTKQTFDNQIKEWQAYEAAIKEAPDLSESEKVKYTAEAEQQILDIKQKQEDDAFSYSRMMADEKADYELMKAILSDKSLLKDKKDYEDEYAKIRADGKKSEEQRYQELQILNDKYQKAVLSSITDDGARENVERAIDNNIQELKIESVAGLKAIDDKYNTERLKSAIDFEKKYSDAITKEWIADDAAYLKLLEANGADQISMRKTINQEMLALQYNDVFDPALGTDVTPQQLARYEDYLDKKKALNLSYEKEKANLISDDVEREKQVQLIAAQEVYDKQVALANGSAALELRATQDLANAKAKILSESALKDNNILAGSLDAFKAFSAGLQDMDFGKSVWAGFQAGMSSASKSLKDFTKNSMAKAIDDVNLYGTNTEKGAKAISSAWSDVALNAAGSLLQLEATNKLTLKSTVAAALDALQAMVPIFAAQIFGAIMGTVWSAATAEIAGIAVYAGIMVGLEGLVLAAKAAVAGMWTGGPIEGGERIIRVNERGQEFVMNAGATAKNLKDFKDINDKNLSIEEYVMAYRPDITGKIADDKIIEIYRQSEIQKELIEARLEKQYQASINQQGKIEIMLKNERRQSSEIIGQLTKQNMDLKDANDAILEELRNNTQEVKRWKTAISTRINVKFDGTMRADGGDMVGVIERARVKSLRNS
jgi:hypothetical protein